MTALLDSAFAVLAARGEDMLTLAEWIELARAVAPLRGLQTRDLLTERDLETIAADPTTWGWSDTTDGVLPSPE